MIAHSLMAIFLYITLQLPDSMPQVIFAALEACNMSLSNPILYGRVNIHTTTWFSSQPPIQTTVGSWVCVLEECIYSSHLYMSR